MPQMAPLNWLTLFTMFNLILIICMAKIWFMSPAKSNFPIELMNSATKIKKFNILWKW